MLLEPVNNRKFNNCENYEFDSFIESESFINRSGKLNL